MKTLRDVMRMIRQKVEDEQNTYDRDGSGYLGRTVCDSFQMILNMLDVAIEASISVDIPIAEPVNGECK